MVQITVKVCGPPITSNELRMVWMPGFSSCWNWNGGTLNTLLISLAPESSATVESGGDIDTVRLSYLA